MNMLVIAPHADDEVLGVGGTIIKEAHLGTNVYVCVVTVGHPSMYDEHTRKTIREECLKAHALMGVKETIFLEFPAVLLNEQPRHEINRKLSEVVSRVNPRKAFIPHFGDVHIDHAIVAQSCMVAMRPPVCSVVELYSYETLSETEWNVPHPGNCFFPNVWSDITDTLDSKLAAMSCFQSQLFTPPHSRSLESISNLAKLRGATVGVHAAEAFSCIRKMI
jgi:LmbE family N-acetylglucosaminyl deacetylase